MSFKLKKCVILSSNEALASDNADYVFDHAFAPDYQSSAASMSDRSIRILSASFDEISCLKGHESMIVGLKYGKTTNSLLYSAASDGSSSAVAIWDVRAGAGAAAPASITALPRCEVADLAIGMDDALLAVAVGSAVVFYDPRNMARPLGKYQDCHTDDVTQVRFHDKNPNFLASTGDDGLVCVYNVSVAAQEDAVMSIVNTDGPVRRMGFFGPMDEGMWCLSCIEQATFWHFPSTQRLLSLPNIRADLGVDYLIDCFPGVNRSTKSDPHHMLLLGGTYDGRLRTCTVESEGIQPGEDMSSGHSGVVRCANIIPSSSPGDYGGDNIRWDHLATAGEDGRLCLWSCGARNHCENTPSHAYPPASSGESGPSHSVFRKPGGRGGRTSGRGSSHGVDRFSPY